MVIFTPSFGANFSYVLIYSWIFSKWKISMHQKATKTRTFFSTLPVSENNFCENHRQNKYFTLILHSLLIIHPLEKYLIKEIRLSLRYTHLTFSEMFRLSPGLKQRLLRLQREFRGVLTQNAVFFSYRHFIHRMYCILITSSCH